MRGRDPPFNRRFIATTAACQITTLHYTTLGVSHTTNLQTYIDIEVSGACAYLRFYLLAHSRTPLSSIDKTQQHTFYIVVCCL